jgi:hypothetical protein
MDAASFDFPDAVFATTDATALEGTDAAGGDATATAALDAPTAPIDARMAPVDARMPDATGMCAEGARVSCASSCGTTGSALCAGGRLGACEPPMERCNGADDDCDGMRDDGFACVLGSSGACTTSCGSTGSRVCGDSCSWGACAPPAAELCNGRDEDCDASIDEGFRARVAATTYSELRTRHAPCDGLTQRNGPDCNAAIHRHCGDGCTTSGFGPIENSGDVAYEACVVGEVRSVPWGTLAGFHGPCNGVGERWGPNCNAAIHRYCASHGFVSGFGPVENDAAVAYVTCVRGAEVRMSSYTELRSFLEPCDGTTQRMGDACNAAIHRYCVARGFVSGFGPIENSGDTAFVTCVRP